MSDGNALYHILEGIKTSDGKHQHEGWKVLERRANVKILHKTGLFRQVIGNQKVRGVGVCRLESGSLKPANSEFPAWEVTERMLQA